MFVSRVGFLLGAFLALNAGAPLAAQSDANLCDIEVRVTDPFGRLTQDFELRLLSKTRSVVRAGVHSLRNVPYGEYILWIHAGCCAAERLILVNDRQLLVRMGVPMRFGDSDLPGGNLNVTGVIRLRSRVPGDLWVRVRGIFLIDTREAAVDGKGRFEVHGLDMGTYALEVFDGATIFDTRTFELDPRNSPFPVVVNLRP